MSKEQQPFSPFNENRRLLSPNSLPTSPQHHMSTPPAPQRGLANGVRNVFKIVHGVGETVRGTILGALDNLDNRGEQKHHRIARGGRRRSRRPRKIWACDVARAARPRQHNEWLYAETVPASWNGGAPATWSTFSAVSPTGADSKGTH
ncbi:hypothetical protein MKEN_01302500 [Mycena kentingensis (nom. inval.)]|nr:hypothetical protein MKEN_01302500 [Mycena kentingensis (nom. inval.)]